VRDPSAPPPPPPLAAQEPKKTRGKRVKLEDKTGGDAAPAAERITLCVNTVPNGAFTDFNEYVSEVAREMEEQFQVSDIRAVMDDKSPIAFGRWKGVLAGLIKQNPPPAGTYVAFTRGNEVLEVATEALASLCTGPGQLWRGV
jgi:hypothetical protein